VSRFIIVSFIIGIIIVVLGIIKYVQLQKPLLKLKEASDFSLTDIYGNTFSLSDYKGRIVILDFMATWCSPCREEIRYLKKVFDKYADRVIIISISVSPDYDTDERLQKFVKEYEITWTIARDTANVAELYDISAIPTVVIVDREGRIVYRRVGLVDDITLSLEIDKLLG
jgi:peroxiredoxin